MTAVRRPVSGGARQIRDLAVAIIGFALAAYAIFLLSHVPQAMPAASLGRVTVGSTEQLTLIDPMPGELMSAALQGAGTLAVEAGPGARLVEPSPQVIPLLTRDAADFQPMAPGSGINLRVTNDSMSEAVVAVSLISHELGRHRVTIEPLVQHGDTGFALTSPDSVMRVELLWSTEPPQKPNTGPVLLGDSATVLSLSRAVLEIPAGQRLYVGSPNERKVYADFGARADRKSRGGLAVGAAVIGEYEGQPRFLACGAGRPDALSFPRPGGGLETSRCERTIRLVAMQIDEPLSFQLSGPAFIITQDGVRYWQLLAGIASNVVLQSALMAVVAALIAWVSLRVRRNAA